MEKRFRLAAAEIEPLIPNMGSCIASDRITVDGAKVGYMYREQPDDEVDSGWRFLAGDESPEYLDDADNLAIYAVNTIANYDRDIIPFLQSPTGSQFGRSSEAAALAPVEE